jgi:hypothetical protein
VLSLTTFPEHAAEIPASRSRTRDQLKRLELPLHGAGFGLARLQEWIRWSESEVSRKSLDLLQPVEAEEPDILAETVPSEGIPDWQVVVEVLRFDLAISDRTGLILVSDRRNVLVEEGPHQALCDARLRWRVGGKNAV